LAVLNGIGVEVQRYHDLLGVLPNPRISVDVTVQDDEGCMYELSRRRRCRRSTPSQRRVLVENVRQLKD